MRPFDRSADRFGGRKHSLRVVEYWLGAIQVVACFLKGITGTVHGITLRVLRTLSSRTRCGVARSLPPRRDDCMRVDVMVQPKVAFPGRMCNYGLHIDSGGRHME